MLGTTTNVGSNNNIPGINIAGVQFRRAGKIYDFRYENIEIRVGDHVVVESERGPSLAKVVTVGYLREEKKENKLKPIVRKATSKELTKTWRLTSEEISDFTLQLVKRLELDMRVLKSEIQLWGHKIIIYFTAPGRVDFRELVKELASGLKTRVELKQVGARDETKLLGGLGICGREYCCSSFLREFVPVSIRMAKNQNLALNPSKVSGGCGRLLCCLTYENDVYTHLRQIMPARGTRVFMQEKDEEGTVIKSDLLNQLLLIETQDHQQVMVKLSEVKILEKATASFDEDETLEAADDEWGQDLDLDALKEHMDKKDTGKPQQRNDSQVRQQGPRQQSQRRDQGRDRVDSQQRSQGDNRNKSPSNPNDRRDRRPPSKNTNNSNRNFKKPNPSSSQNGNGEKK